MSSSGPQWHITALVLFLCQSLAQGWVMLCYLLIMTRNPSEEVWFIGAVTHLLLWQKLLLKHFPLYLCLILRLPQQM